MIIAVLDELAASGPDSNVDLELRIRNQVTALCRRFPIYP